MAQRYETLDQKLISFITEQKNVFYRHRGVNRQSQYIAQGYGYFSCSQ